MTDFSVIRSLFHYKDNCGFSEEAIDIDIKKWGALPKVLADYYQQLGKYEDLNYAQDRLCPLKEFDDYICFYEEAQGAMHWCISKEDFNKDNPPVYCHKWQDGKYVFLQESKDLITFFNAMANGQALYCFEYNSEGFICPSDKELENVKLNFKKRSFGFKHSSEIDFYGNYDDDVICLVKSGDKVQLSYASKDLEQFEAIEKIIFEG